MKGNFFLTPNFLAPSGQSPRLSFNQKWRWLGIATLASFGLITGVVPSVSGPSLTLEFSTSAYAQVNDQDVTNYARTVLTIEPLRQTAYNEIKKRIGKEPPPIMCDDADSLRNLDGAVRPIAVQYCKQSRGIVTSNFNNYKNPDEAVKRFNEITLALQSDTNLKTRVNNELIRLQRAGSY